MFSCEQLLLLLLLFNTVEACIGVGETCHVMRTVAREREGVRNTSGFNVMPPRGAPGGCGEARGVPHLGHAKE